VSEQCYPYTSGDGTEPACVAGKCTGNGEYKKYKCGTLFESGSVAEIKEEVSTNGPMETGFMVYRDFMTYKSGVYQHVTGEELGGHAVAIIGYGNEGGLDYWLCKNSWGPSWGDNGYFKIKHGDCGVDVSVWTCDPALSNAHSFVQE